MSVILAAYNEAGNVGPLISKIRSVIQKSDELIVVDDASTDSTIQEIDRNQVTLIRHLSNQGKGAAIRSGIRAASGDCICLMDADGQDDPRDIPRLMGPLVKGNADFVIGSRFLLHNQDISVTPVNRLANRGLTFLLNFLFKVGLTDSQSSFKCIKADLLKFLRLESNRYEFETELLIRSRRKRAVIVEVPVGRFARRYGKSHLFQIPFGRFKFGLRVLWVILKGYFFWR